MADEVNVDDPPGSRWRLADVHASLRSAVDNNTVHSVTSTLLRQLSSQATPNNINLTQTTSTGGGSDHSLSSSFTVDMANSHSTIDDSQTDTSHVTHHDEPSQSDNTTNNASSQNTTDPPNANSDISLADCLNSSLLFAFILFVKLMYDHKLGILVCIAFFVTFHFSDKKLQSQVYLSMIRDSGSQQKRSKLFLMGMVLFLSLNIAVTYFAFSDQQLHKSLYLHLPGIDIFDFWSLLWVMIYTTYLCVYSLYLHLPVIDIFDFWSLLWVVIITDFVIKFSCIILKAVIAVLPRSTIPFNRRGKYYVLIEETSQLYRMLVPVLPWIYFLITDQHAGLWFSMILVLIYLCAKAFLLWKKVLGVIKAYRKVTVNLILGKRPTIAVGDVCAICHDSFKDPVELSCSHVFCEDCVCVWFDREPTCPMCRAKIGDDPEWRNGATSAHLQWY